MNRVPRLPLAAATRLERALIAAGPVLLALALALVWIPAAIAFLGVVSLYAGLFVDFAEPGRDRS